MGTSPVDFEAVIGWKGAFSAPSDFSHRDLRRWSVNRFHNARYGGHLRADGLTQLRSVHPMRAMNVMGTSINLPPFEYSYVSPELPVDGDETAFDTVTNVPFAAFEPINVDCRTSINFQTGYASFIMNGIVQDDRLFLGANESGGVYSDRVHVRDWENLIGQFGQLQVQFVNFSGIIEVGETHWFQFTITFQAAA